MASPPPEPTWRKPIGIIGMLVYMTVYALVISQFADALANLPQLVMALFYLVAGVVWVLPLRPLFLWMNTGHWTDDGDNT